MTEAVAFELNLGTEAQERFEPEGLWSFSLHFTARPPCLRGFSFKALSWRLLVQTLCPGSVIGKWEF